MAVGDSVLYPIDVISGSASVVVPGQPGKRVRIWRSIMTFDGPDGEKGVMTWASGSTASEFFVQSGDRAIMGHEALAWFNGDEGEPLVISVDADISIKGSVRAEHVA